MGKQPPSRISVSSAPIEAIAELKKLDEGERAAITLAQSLNADLILVDERKGREAAIAQGLNVVGVIGVLDEAAETKLIDISSAISRLQQTNFRISPRIIQALLSRHT